jgi:uroporphyrinogen-III decarboxylase
VRVYHNDANIEPFLEDLVDVGFDVLNFTYKLDLAQVRKRTAGKICLMGNIPPVDIGTRGSAQEVRAATLDLLRKVGKDGVILSVGGGVSPGMPGANVAAMVEAVARSTHSKTSISGLPRSVTFSVQPASTGFEKAPCFFSIAGICPPLACYKSP